MSVRNLAAAYLVLAPQAKARLVARQVAVYLATVAAACLAIRLRLACHPYPAAARLAYHRLVVPVRRLACHLCRAAHLALARRAPQVHKACNQLARNLRLARQVPVRCPRHRHRHRVLSVRKAPAPCRPSRLRLNPASHRNRLFRLSAAPVHLRQAVRPARRRCLALARSVPTWLSMNPTTPLMSPTYPLTLLVKLAA